MSNRVKLGPRWGRFLACGGIALCLLAAYSNSFSGQFVLDDDLAIQQNPTITNLADLRQVFSPPRVSAVTARPVINFTLAVDHALWGWDVRGYHATNLMIHVGAALLLFGVIRRVWLRWANRSGADARPSPMIGGKDRSSTQVTLWAAAIALVWALHPLQTESVTFIVMRSESLAGFFYLLTLYSSVRYVEDGGRRWGGGAVAACCLGVMSKEYAVSAPLLVLALDRTAYAGSFREALRDRRWLYFGLLFSWLPLVVVLVQSGADRGGTGGFGTVVSPWHYLLTQCRALVIYLKLAFWPNALCFDYGRAIVHDLWSVTPQAMLLLGLVGATAVGLWRRSLLGLAGLWFFAVISPSSSFVPLASQTAAEHRMYLPLAAVVIVVAAVAYRLFGRCGWMVLALVAPVLGALTFNRNALYADPIALWQDTVIKQPNNARAWGNLGDALIAAGRGDEALVKFETGLVLMQDREALIVANYANALLSLGRVNEAEVQARRALVIDPHCERALGTLGSAASQKGEYSTALEWFARQIELAPGNLGARINRANTLMKCGDRHGAEREYCVVLDRSPGNSLAEFGLGRLAYDKRDWQSSIYHYEQALRNNPRFAEGHNNLAGALIECGRPGEALPHYAKAVELDPKLTVARLSYATMLAQSGRLPEAVDHYCIALDQEPANVKGQINYGLAQQMLGRIEEARARYLEALRYDPGNAIAQGRLEALRLKNAGGQ